MDTDTAAVITTAKTEGVVQLVVRSPLESN